jgi:menaquinone-9 beta-reductase
LKTPSETDILIAGAGPAGVAASLFLCKEQIPHTIIDQSSFPRDKVCGDALSGKAVQILNQLNTDWIPEINKAANQFLGSYGVIFGAPDGNLVEIPFSTDLSSLKYPPGFVSRRTDFDHFLFSKIDKRHASVHQQTKLVSIERTGSGLLLHLKKDGQEMKVSTRLLIGTEGDRSVASRTLTQHRKEDQHYCAGVRGYYRNVKGFHARNFIELHFLPGLLPGYLWVFPLPNGGANVGVGMLSSVVKKRRVNLREIMIRSLNEHPNLKDRFRDARPEGELMGWGLPLGSGKRKISGDHFLLGGDAASLIDPFTGEGIGNAMISGKHAAATAIQALRENRFDAAFLSRYDAEVYRVLGPELNLSHTLQRLSQNAWLFNLVVRKAKKNKMLRDTITCMFEDVDLRKRLRDPFFYMKLIFNRS